MRMEKRKNEKRRNENDETGGEKACTSDVG